MTAIDRAPLDELVTAYADEHDCPTVAWGVVIDGDLALSGAVGDVDEHTVYRIASMTKSFSAAVTLLLRDEGVMSLDDPVTRHAPELAALRGPTADAAPVTVRDLLAMTSGIVSDDAWADRHLDLSDDEFDRLVATGATFAAPTGTAFGYSNVGYAALGRVVHRATGSRIQRVISDRLLTPLGMHATTWTHPGHALVAPPMRCDDGELTEELPTPGDGVIAPMGGLWSTVADLARWVAWLDDAFPARDGADRGPLRRAARREMQTSQQFAGVHHRLGEVVPTSYGYGLRIRHEPVIGTVVTHSGGLPGYGSNMRWLPGRRLGVITLANVTYAPMTELGARLVDLLHEAGHVPAERPRVTPAVDRAGRLLCALLDDWDDARADELFSDNVALDEPYARRGAEAARCGGFGLVELAARDDASGRATVATGDGHRRHLDFTLAPHDATRIQQYSIGEPLDDTDPAVA